MRAVAERLLHDLFDPGDQRVVVAIGGHHGRRHVDRVDFVIHVVAVAVEDHPLVADKDPGADAVLVEDVDRLAGNLGREADLLDDGEVGFDDGAAVVAAERQGDGQRIAHRLEPEGRPAAAEGEADAGGVEPAHGGDRGGAQRFLGGDKGAVDIADDELDPAHGAPRVKTSTPSAEATTTAELRPTNSPLSTTPTMAAMRHSSAAASAIRPKRQSRM